MFSKCGKKPYSIVKGTDYAKIEKRIAETFGREIQPPTNLMATVGQIMQTSQKELFFSLMVVLVEGEEDVAFIATHLNLTGEWKTFRRNGCHFVVSDGKNNMPRFITIAQEFGIPIFVICDSDMESILKKLERAEKLQEDDINKAEKIRNSKEELKKRKEINGAITSLCGLKIENSSECKTIKGDNIIMWKDTIGSAVESSFEGEEWQETQNSVVEKYGYERVKEKKKNGMVIAATLEELYKNGKQSAELIDLCGRISQYAQRVEDGRNL